MSAPQAAATALPPGKLKVALCQMTSTDNLADNVRQVGDLLAQVPDDVTLACFPENSLYFRLSKNEKIPTFKTTDAVFAELQKIVEQKKIAVLLGSVPMLLSDGRTGNSTVYLRPHHPVEVVYRKIHLFDVGVAGAPPVRESDNFVHGVEGYILNLQGWRLGLSICYDVRFSELYAKYSKENVHAILVPSAFLVPTGKVHWHILLRARAIESQCYVLAAAQAGRHVSKNGESRQTYGHSLAVDPWGEVIADLNDSGPELTVVTLDPERLKWVQQQIPQSGHHRLPR